MSSQIFEILPAVTVVVCRQCQYAVVPSQVEVHLRAHHPGYSLQQRKEMQQEVQRLEGVAFEKDQVCYPEKSDLPITGSLIFGDGLKCKAPRIQGVECQYTCRDLKTMQKHCREAYNWGSQKRGDVRRKRAGGEGRMWEEGVHCQRIFEFAQRKRSFQVSQQLEHGSQPREGEANDGKMERLAE